MVPYWWVGVTYVEADANMHLTQHKYPDGTCHNIYTNFKAVSEHVKLVAYKAKKAVVPLAGAAVKVEEKEEKPAAEDSKDSSAAALPKPKRQRTTR